MLMKHSISAAVVGPLERRVSHQPFLKQLDEFLKFGLTRCALSHVRVIALLIRTPIEVDACVRLGQGFGLSLTDSKLNRCHLERSVLANDFCEDRDRVRAGMELEVRAILRK